MEEHMKDNITPSVKDRNFILQQGFDEPPSHTSHLQYSALLFQPRIVGLTGLIGILFQSPPVFFALTVVIWWSALLPKWNPFDAVYNLMAGSKPGAVRLTPAPPPRRFAQGMAGLFALLIAVSLILGWRVLAYVLEGLFVVTVSALVFGGFCLGSFIYHVLVGRGEFARRTLPWVRR
jgi:hypothetical protein